ncbi:MAG TPA: sugar O-acyltransferase [Buttiauxella sp.]|nr:sugar O-acyltransferase [Buttiauxella sp.]
MEKNLLIIGAGGHGRSVAEVAVLSGEFSQIAFLDDSWQIGASKTSNIIGRTEHLAEHKQSFNHVMIAIGNNTVREKMQKRVLDQGINLTTLIHPTAFISSSAQIGIGTVVFAGVVIGANTRIGDNVIINCNSTVDHDGFVDDFVHIGIGVQLAGSSHIGRGAFIQAGSCAGFNAVAEPYAVFAPGSILKSRA